MPVVDAYVDAASDGSAAVMGSAVQGKNPWVLARSSERSTRPIIKLVYRHQAHDELRVSSYARYAWRGVAGREQRRAGGRAVSVICLVYCHFPVGVSGTSSVLLFKGDNAAGR